MANSSRGGGVSATALWAVGALLVMGVFVAWLAMSARPSVPPAPPAEDTTQTAGATGTAQPVSAADFEPNVDQYRGQAIELQDVPVQQQMGNALFWVELPSGSPFLVKLSDALVGAGGMPAAQTRVNVQGTVVAKTDSVLAAWEQAGLLPSAGDRELASFGTSYIEATAVRPTR